MFLLTCQYFGKMEKKSSCRKLGLHFTSISLLELKSYAMKVQGELPGCFFHCTMEWLQPYAPTTSFKLMALRNTVECQCYNETNIPLSSKTQQKIIFNFVACQVRLILCNTNLNTKKNNSYVKTALKKF